MLMKAALCMIDLGCDLRGLHRLAKSLLFGLRTK